MSHLSVFQMHLLYDFSKNDNKRKIIIIINTMQHNAT